MRRRASGWLCRGVHAGPATAASVQPAFLPAPSVCRCPVAPCLGLPSACPTSPLPPTWYGRELESVTHALAWCSQPWPSTHTRLARRGCLTHRAGMAPAPTPPTCPTHRALASHWHCVRVTPAPGPFGQHTTHRGLQLPPLGRPAGRRPAGRPGAGPSLHLSACQPHHTTPWHPCMPPQVTEMA